MRIWPVEMFRASRCHSQATCQTPARSSGSRYARLGKKSTSHVHRNPAQFVRRSLPKNAQYERRIKLESQRTIRMEWSKKCCIIVNKNQNCYSRRTKNYLMNWSAVWLPWEKLHGLVHHECTQYWYKSRMHLIRSELRLRGGFAFYDRSPLPKYE